MVSRARPRAVRVCAAGRGLGGHGIGGAVVGRGATVSRVRPAPAHVRLPKGGCDCRVPAVDVLAVRRGRAASGGSEGRQLWVGFARRRRLGGRIFRRWYLMTGKNGPAARFCTPAAGRPLGRPGTSQGRRGPGRVVKGQQATVGQASAGSGGAGEEAAAPPCTPPVARRVPGADEVRLDPSPVALRPGPRGMKGVAPERPGRWRAAYRGARARGWPQISSAC